MFFHAVCRQGGRKRGRGRRRRGENRLSFLYIHDDIIFFAAAAEDYSAGINFGAKRLSCAALPCTLSLTSLHGIQGAPEVNECNSPPTRHDWGSESRGRLVGMLCAVAPILNALKADT